MDNTKKVIDKMENVLSLLEVGFETVCKLGFLVVYALKTVDEFACRVKTK